MCNVAISGGQVRFVSHRPTKHSGNDDCEETKLLSHLHIEHGSTGKFNSLTKLTGEACGRAETLKSTISSLSIHEPFIPPLCASFRFYLKTSYNRFSKNLDES